MAKQFSERQKFVIWMRQSWENMLKYIVHNNPDTTLEVLCDDCGIEPGDYTTEQIETMAFDAAKNSGDPEIFTGELAYLIPHNNENNTWANLLNYNHG